MCERGQGRHRTGHHDTPLEAAIEFAQMREDLDLGIYQARRKKKPPPPASDAACKKADVGVDLDCPRLLLLPGCRADRSSEKNVTCVHCREFLDSSAFSMFVKVFLRELCTSPKCTAGL